jgi:hypothetical protein
MPSRAACACVSPAGLHLAHEIVVIDELVAALDEQVGRGVLHAHADHALVVLAQLRDERGKVRIAAHDHERVDVRLGVAEVERIHDHVDVGRVLAGLLHVRYLDELEAREVHAFLEVLVPVPIAVRLAHHDGSFEKQALDDELHVEIGIVRFAHAEGDVLEIAEKCEVLRVSQGSHAG